LKEVLKAMATGRKGNGTAVRRRTRSGSKELASKESAAKETAITVLQDSNGSPAYNGSPAHNSAHWSKIDTETESIRTRAYELFLSRGALHGNDLGDWLNAERELRGA
jgi:Protein of unknown function (DUF2934)